MRDIDNILNVIKKYRNKYLVIHTYNIYDPEKIYFSEYKGGFISKIEFYMYDDYYRKLASLRNKYYICG